MLQATDKEFILAVEKHINQKKRKSIHQNTVPKTL